MSYNTSKDIPWGHSMLMGVQFIFKDKTVVVPDLPQRFTSVQNYSSKYEFNFDYERKILKDYEAAEEQERRKLKEEVAAKAEKEEMKESSAPAAPRLTILEPEKSVMPSQESTLKPPIKFDRSILEDFEFQALRDDPFVAAELGTINDLEELRDVLASMQNVEPTESKKISMRKSLKNISFPHLSLYENAPNGNAIASSAPSSQPNLSATNRQPILTCDTPECASDSNNIDKDHDKNERSSSSRNANASPIKFDLESDTTKSDNERQIHSIDSDCDSSSSVSLQKVKFHHSSPSFRTVTHIPIPMGNEMHEHGHSQRLSDARSMEPPSGEEQCQPEDPPVVQRLVKMGFKRLKALALYKVVSKRESTVSDECMISQLCSWNELEEKGLEPSVCLAAVIFAPNDLEQAFKFGTIVSELCEMGFPMDSVITAVLTSNMNKEEAVMHLLDPSGSSSSPTSSQPHFSHNHLPHLSEPLTTRKGKKKEKKSYMSYLHTKR